jgi:hypothetical protein
LPSYTAFFALALQPDGPADYDGIQVLGSLSNIRRKRVGLERRHDSLGGGKSEVAVFAGSVRLPVSYNGAKSVGTVPGVF